MHVTKISFSNDTHDSLNVEKKISHQYDAACRARYVVEGFFLGSNDWMGNKPWTVRCANSLSVRQEMYQAIDWLGGLGWIQ